MKITPVGLCSRKFQKFFYLIACASLITGLPGYGLAKEGLILEEVTVTATKRESSLQDVPISVAVISGERIEQAGITELEDLAPQMPNVHIAEANTGTNLFIRGVGSGVNFGFEQSVGTFIDGVYFGRGRDARAAFLDLERVEVLKGPQSTLFGKNTVAGAINITTARPTDELTGYVQAAYEDSTDGLGVTAVLSGPLSDTVRGRVVVKRWKDDGWVKNTYLATDGPGDDILVGRVKLEWDATENLTFSLKLEQGKFDVTGRQKMISIASPTATFLNRTFGDPNFEANFGYSKSDANIVTPEGLRDEFDNTDSKIYQLNAEYDAEKWSLRSITALTGYDYVYYQDGDHGPLQFIGARRKEEHEQFSQEFLLTSQLGGAFEYLAGLYYQSADLDATTDLNLMLSNLPPIEGAIFGLLGFPPETPSGFLDITTFNIFKQNTTSYSAFAELTWHVSDSFRTIFGVRFSRDEKEMFKQQYVASLFDDTPDPFLGFIYGVNVLKLTEPFTFDENTPGFDNTRNENHVTGNINFSWDMTDEAMLYFNAANGYKAGGYDEDNRLANIETEQYEDESVLAFELGLKLGFWNGRGRLNMAAFQATYDDIQVSTFDGNCCFVVGNAAKSESKGVEGDFVLAVTKKFRLNGAFSFLDAKYKNFPNAACNILQVQDGSCAANGGVQDLSGKPLQFAPDVELSLAGDYTTLIASSLELGLTAGVLYSDGYVVANDLDPNLIQGSYTRVNARIYLTGPDGRWTLAVVGRNLTDEKTFTWGNDVPLSTLGFANTYFQFIDPPRTFEVQARWSF